MRLRPIDWDPLVSHIGSSLLVARSVSELDRNETAALIECTRAMVALKRPEHQAFGTQLLGSP